MNITDIILIIINFAGALAVFLFSMKMMSEGLQKVAGSRMRSILRRFTGTPLSGILTGTAITAAVQSSSATTVMVVGFVSAGLLSLEGAVAVIMGANIGTTVTAWIITLLGLGGGEGYFHLSLLIGAASLVFLFSKRDRMKSIGQTIVGLALLLVGMELLQAAMPNLESYPALLQALATLSGYGFWSVLLFVAIGALLTCVVQASAAMMAITLLMCYNGWIGFDVAVALVMGQNIGTTITANLAAMVAGTAGKKAARAHLLFNVFGVLLSLLFFGPIVKFIQWVFPTDVPMAIALFHTIFNVAGTSIQAFFIPQIIKVVNWMVKEPPAADGADDDRRLTYLEPKLLSTAELNLQSARSEIEEFSQQVLDMYSLLPTLDNAGSQQQFDQVLQRIAECERQTDSMDMALVRYLTRVGSGDLSRHASERVSAMLRISDNLESIGDTIYQIGLAQQNKRAQAVNLGEGLAYNLTRMSTLVQHALEVMDRNLHDYEHADLQGAYAAEQAINNLRDELRTHHLEAVKRGLYTYTVGSAYSNIYALYEKLGDYVINVSEAIDYSQHHTV